MQSSRWLLASCLLLALMISFSARPASCHKKIKAGPSHYKFYLHNTVYNTTINNSYFTSVYGPRPPGSFSDPFSFGVVATFEAPLTLGASNSSASAGLARGFYVMDSQKAYVLFHCFTATIDDGTYNGTLIIMGQIVEAQTVRTLSVVGGTGDFLFARGLVADRRVELIQAAPARWTLSFDLDLYYF